MENYDTVVAALAGLKARGYTLDFNIGAEKLHCPEHEIFLHPDEFEITETYRFEGATNPADEDVVYAVESKDGRVRGTVTSAFGAYADDTTSDMIRKLSLHH